MTPRAPLDHGPPTLGYATPPPPPRYPLSRAAGFCAGAAVVGMFGAYACFAEPLFLASLAAGVVGLGLGLAAAAVERTRKSALALLALAAYWTFVALQR